MLVSVNHKNIVSINLISLIGQIWVHKTSFIPPLFIETAVPSEESDCHVYVCWGFQLC